MAIINSGIYQKLMVSGIQQPNASLFVVGDGGYVAYITVDNEVIDVSPAGYSSFSFMDIDFTDSGRVGWIVTSSSPTMVMKSENYGLTWFSAYTISDAQDARFIKASPHNDFVYIGAEVISTSFSRLFRSSGDSFSSLYTPGAGVTGPFEDVAFKTTVDSYVGLLHNQYTFTSSTSGDSFTLRLSTGALSMDSLYVYDDTHAYCGIEATQSNPLIKFTASGLGTIEANYGSFSPSQGIKSIQAITPDHVLASCADGYFARFSGANQEVFTQVVNTTEDCEDIAFANTSLGYMSIGKSVHYTTDTGDTWSQIYSGSNYIRAIKIVNN